MEINDKIRSVNINTKRKLVVRIAALLLLLLIIMVIILMDKKPQEYTAEQAKAVLLDYIYTYVDKEKTLAIDFPDADPNPLPTVVQDINGISCYVFDVRSTNEDYYFRLISNWAISTDLQRIYELNIDEWVERTAS